MSDSLISGIQSWFIIADEAQGFEGVIPMTKQMGFHVEEFREFLIGLKISIGDKDNGHIADLIEELANLRTDLVKGKYNECLQHVIVPCTDVIGIKSATEIIDACGDQIVTATGILKRMGVDAVEVVNRVNKSNYSKFNEDGTPVITEEGKIGKSENYRKPTFLDLIV